MKIGIASRIAIIFTSLLFVATGTTGYMVYQEARESLMDASTQRLAHAAEVVRVRHAAGIESITKDVNFLTSTPPVHGIVRARMRRGLDPETALLTGEWGEQLAEIFQVFLQDRPSYLRASFAELRGSPRPLVVVDRPGAGEDRAVALTPPHELARAIMPADTTLSRGTVYYSDIDLIADSAGGGTGFVPVVHATMPVFDVSDALFGAVTVSVDLRSLLSTLSSLVGPNKTLFVADREGAVMNVPEGPYALDHGGRRAPNIGELFPTLHEAPPGVQVLGEDLDAGDDQEPGLAYVEHLDYDGPDGARQLTVAVVSPHDVILAGVTGVRQRSVLIVLLFSLGGALLALGFSRFLTRPLSRITGAVSQFADGASNIDLPVRRSDEIGVLARAFNGMAGQIRDQMAVLEDKERRQRTILETAAEAIVVTDARGRIETVNPAAERLFGYEADEIVGDHVRVLLPQNVQNEDETAAPVGSWRDVGPGRDATARRKDGADIAVSLSVSTYTLAQEHKYALFLMDITSRKEYETALQDAKEEAEEMARLKSDFLASMSHEIRTPLTAVIGFAAMLANELPDQHARFAQVIERSGRRLMDTLNAVLSLAQLESQQMEVDLDVLHVPEEVEEVTQFFKPHATDKGLDLRCTVTAEARRSYARLDRGALGSVLQNLIGNAIKFTDEGSVDVRVDANDDTVKIRVRDTGVGIEASFLPYLFEPFRQESSGIARSHEGSGLGLALTKRLVDLMNGEVSVESTKGEGTTFTVAFDRAHDDSATEDTDRRKDTIDTEREDADDAAVPQAQILVVDDNVETGLLVRNVLGDVGTVTMALDAQEALDEARDTRYDLVLLDINLGSGMSGVDILDELRAFPAYAHVPIIAVTAYALPGDRERILKTGFDDYVSKPFTPDVLHRHVHRALYETPDLPHDEGTA